MTPFNQHRGQQLWWGWHDPTAVGVGALPHDLSPAHRETIIRKRRLLFAGAVRRTINERLAHRFMFGTMGGEENPGLCRPGKNWAQCLTDDIRVVQATEGSTGTSPLLVGVETVPWPRAAKKSGNWYRMVVDAADRFMARWHSGEAEKSWLHHAAVDAKSSDKGKAGGRELGGQPH